MDHQHRKRISASGNALAANAVSRRNLLKSSAGLGGAIAISRWTSSPARAAIDQNTLVIADDLVAHWRNLDPAYFYEGNPSAAMYLIYETLYHLPDGTKLNDVQPLVAAELPTYSDDSLVVTVPLRTDITFQTTGNPLTAADIVFSFNRLKNVGMQGAFLATDYWDIVEAVDEHTVRFTMSVPNASLPAVLCAPMLSITDSKAVIALGGTDAPPSTDDENAPELLANLGAQDAINQASVGSGPFMVENWDLNGEVRLVRNPDYWNGLHTLERVIWRNTLDINAQLQSVQIGEADIATNINAAEVSSVQDNAELQILDGATLAIQYLGINQREDWSGVLGHKSARHALATAIDYEGIIEALLYGRAQRPATPVALPLEGSQAVLPEAFQTDLAGAQQLWDEGGGGEATIDLIYASDSTGRGGVDLNSLAAKVQSDLEKIEGLTVRLGPMANSQRSELYRAGEFQVTIASWIPDFPGTDAYATPFFRTDASASSRVGYSDPETDILLDQAAAELDPETRDGLYADVQRRGLDACPYITLYQPDDVKIAIRNVQGVQVHPVYAMQLRNASKTA